MAGTGSLVRSAAVAIWLVLLPCSPAGTTDHARGTDDHEPERPQESQGTTSQAQDAPTPKPERSGVPRDELTGSGTALSLDTVVRDLTLADFPTLHPLAVHVPVTFIPAALVFAVLGLFVSPRAFTWLALAFALGGLAGAFLAAVPLHPHTTGLPAAAEVTLEKHELFAFATLAFGLLAVLAAVGALWRTRRLPRILLSLLLLMASACVSIAGHYGGMLAYVHGVGVKGNYLSSH